MTTSMALNVGTYLSQKNKKNVGTYYDAVKAIFRPSYVGLSQPHQHATNITPAQHNLRCKSKNLCEAFYM